MDSVNIQTINKQTTSAGRRYIFATLCFFVCMSASCGDGEGENTGSSCDVAADCFPDVSEELQGGDAFCLEPEKGGYCTHECTDDNECCAVDGECDTNLQQVCAPFTNVSETKYCFLSCEDTDLESSDFEDADTYCNELAGRDFTCRSTGGGSENRKVCFPPG